MRGGAIALAGVAIAASAATWAFSSSKPEAVAAAPRHVSSNPSSSAGDRVFLTRAQLAQAMAGGTFDRPVKSLLSVGAPLHFGDYVWNDRGVPAGQTWVRVDLSSQLISVFRAGHEIGTAVIVYGADGLPTPAGKFPILAKLRDHRSQTYDAPMPYTLRLTGDGVSIHGSSVRWGAATHGCIGVPLAFAERLFSAAQVGDEVVIVGNPPHSRTS
jgi:lipoprotein-anchoring transpeptidase ErfK/SrfK